MTLPLPGEAVPEVYVLWHPRCPIGELAAKRIHAWLRPGFGLGPRVFYRSLPAPAVPGDPVRPTLPLPLPGENRFARGKADQERSEQRRGANLQIVLPLIDDHMVADPAWRAWLEDLRRKQPPSVSREILPIALDPTAFGAPPLIRELNFIRPQARKASLEELDGREREALLRSLLKQLTEALCRILLGRAPSPDGAAGALKLKVFLSHAKADGTGPARRLRDYIYSQTQLAAFYDENDIPFGSAFARVLNREAESQGTVALIAVRSSKYALRPWCRREISLFRKPRPAPGIPGRGMLWRLNPVLVVGATDSATPTVGVPELGNAPELRWSDDVPDQEEQVVTTLLRDAMLAQFHASAARDIASAPADVVLNWLPDPTTLLRVDAVREGRELTVHYPGHLTALDEEMLAEFFPRLQFKSFEESWS